MKIRMLVNSMGPDGIQPAGVVVEVSATQAAISIAAGVAVAVGASPAPAPQKVPKPAVTKEPEADEPEPDSDGSDDPDLLGDLGFIEPEDLLEAAKPAPRKGKGKQ